MANSSSRRRSLRRHVGVTCSIANDLWDGTVEFGASDLSHDGLWIDTWYPLELGDEVVLSFVPPGAPGHEELWASAQVARVGLWDARHAPWDAGMGLVFTYLDRIDRRFLESALMGRPPRLPRKKPVSQPPPQPVATRRPPPLPSAQRSTGHVEPGALQSLPSVRRTHTSARGSTLRFADVPPVLDADLAFEFRPVSLGSLLTAPRPQGTYRSSV
jgi:hypothetical protein